MAWKRMGSITNIRAEFALSLGFHRATEQDSSLVADGARDVILHPGCAEVEQVSRFHSGSAEVRLGSASCKSDGPFQPT